MNVKSYRKHRKPTEPTEREDVHLQQQRQNNPK